MHLDKWTRTVRNTVAVTKKYRNFGSFLGVQEQKVNSGVMHPDEKKNKSEKETNPSLISVFINVKR